MQRSFFLIGIYTALTAGCSGLDLDEPPDVIHARFDPEAGAIPMPTDVVRDAELGRLDIPLDDDLDPAERELFAYLNTLDGWSTTMPATVELTGPIAPTTVTPDSVQVWQWRETPTRVEDVTVSLDATETRLTIDPPRDGWERGGRYVVMLRGGDAGVEGKRGERVEADAAFYFLRLEEPLDAPEHERAFPGDNAADRRDAARELENIRLDLAPFFDFFAERDVPRREVAALWSFTVTTRTELATDKVSQRMPLPIDLLRDPATGLIDVPVAPWDSEVVAAAKAALGELDGFGISPDLLFGFTAPVDPSTISTDTITLVPVDASGAAGDPVEITTHLLEDQSHVVVTPARPLEEKSRYALLLSQEIRDRRGQPIALMPAAVLMRAAAPVHVDGASRLGSLDDDDAARIEQVRAIAHPLVADRSDVLAAWTFTTMSITEPMDELLDLPETTAVDPDPVVERDESPLSALGSFPLGVASLGRVDRVYHGTIESPQFLDRLTRGWRGDGGHEVEDIPFTLIIPKLEDGESAPVVVFTHGLQIERRYVLALGNALAKRGFAAVAIDLPYHGERTSCWSEEEARTAIDPETGEMVELGEACRGDAVCSDDGRCVEPDGSPGELTRIPLMGTPSYSGTTFIEIDRIANTRDHIRQALVDLSALVRSLEEGRWSEIVGVPLDTDEIHYTGVSLGGVLGATLVGASDDFDRAVLNVPGADTVSLFAESPAFSGRIEALLEREGTEHGEYEAEKLLAAGTWLMDSVDPQSFAEPLGTREALVQMATLDTVIPNPYTELLTELSGLPRRDYVASHAFIALPLEPEHGRGASELADFLAEELEL